MNAINYNGKMREIIQKLDGEKPKLLLHVCCAPCSSACLERLFGHFSVTTFFYNPNIEREEYLKRRCELEKLLKATGWAENSECGHDESEFYNAVRGQEKCPEGGERCATCFNLRLERTALAARENGFDYFATTLTLSPLKNAEVINRIGYDLEKKYGVKWLPNDFKKENGYLRSLELCRIYDLYRQNYCGCVYSRQTLDK